MQHLFEFVLNSN